MRRMGHAGRGRGYTTEVCLLAGRPRLLGRVEEKQILDMDAKTRVEELERFLRFAMVDWPHFRAEKERGLAKRCRRCILSERAAPLVDGLCPECRAPAAEVKDPGAGDPAEAAALDDLLRNYTGRGRGQYDALVLFSGGKDSGLMLYRLRTDYPNLRLLALTVDNGFISQVAVANAARIVARVGGVDHELFKPRATLFEKTFRHAFTHLRPGGCYETVDLMDGALTFDIGRNRAAQMEIPLVIGALSGAQVDRILGLSTFESPPEEERVRRVDCAGFRLEQLYTPDELRFWWNGEAWPAERLPRVLYPFHAWPYNEGQIREQVRQLGLIEPGHDDPVITNNDTIPVMLAVDNNYLGYSGFEPEFASLVRKGEAPREVYLNLFQAAEYLARKGELMPRCIDDTLARLGLSRKDVGISEGPRAAR